MKTYTEMIMALITLVLLSIGFACWVYWYSCPVVEPIELRMSTETDGPEMQKAKKMIYDQLEKERK